MRHANGSSLSASMKSTALQAACVCSEAKVCVSLVLMDRADKTEQEEGAIEKKRFEMKDSMSVTFRLQLLKPCTTPRGVGVATG